MPIIRYSEKPEFKTIDELINSWLKSREELLVAYYKAANIFLFDEEPKNKDLEYFNNFLNNLIDYASIGHFEIFQKMIDISVAGNESDRVTLDQSIILELLYSTSTILEFYKKYKDKHKPSEKKFKQDVSCIGEELTDRFDLEDILIESYINASSKLKEMLPSRSSNKTA